VGLKFPSVYLSHPHVAYSKYLHDYLHNVEFFSCIMSVVAGTSQKVVSSLVKNIYTLYFTYIFTFSTKEFNLEIRVIC